MTISSGVRRHRPFLVVNGQSFPILSGSYEKKGSGEAATFGASLPIGTDFDFFADLGENEASLVLRDGGSDTTIIAGELKETTFDVISGRISVSGQCKLAKLHEKKTSEKFTNQSNTEIVEKLAKNAGLKTNVAIESAGDAGRYVQIDWTQVTDNVSYASVIQKIAEAEGARWFVSGDTLHFVSQDDEDATTYPITLVRGENGSGLDLRGDALKISIKRNIVAGKNVHVTTKSWNSRKKEAVVGEYKIGGAPGTTAYGYHVSGLTQAQADKHAKSKAKQAARHEFEVTVDCVGDLAADPSKKLRLGGCGRFDQDYAIDSIRGQVGMSGHTMTITSRAGKKLRDGKTGRKKKKASK